MNGRDVDSASQLFLISDSDLDAKSNRISDFFKKYDRIVESATGIIRNREKIRHLFKIYVTYSKYASPIQNIRHLFKICVTYSKYTSPIQNTSQLILMSLHAQLSGEQHIQIPRQSGLAKWRYGHFKFVCTLEEVSPSLDIKLHLTY